MITKLEGTRTGIRAFCAGVGPQFPDIVAADDRMTLTELNICVANNVPDVIEVTVGGTFQIVQIAYDTGIR